ncbi:Lsr2 family protein [Microbacterium sp. G2-8]|uniref:histone-like nucleoid-structuring protein Lsr2 n=1 Tax=Microbacterium sp. G2-8 TaxID=2842454 RepID=UPI001C8AD8A3|nr:Lsr2 family protein [Microbacterium sp. G2-8]
MKRTVHLLVDDLDGSALPADEGETLEFGLDGRDYEIDLSAQNAAALRTALEPFIAAARRSEDSSRTAEYTVTHLPTTRPRGENARIRKWAKQNGYAISERGAIPQSVREAYRARG